MTVKKQPSRGKKNSAGDGSDPFDLARSLKRKLKESVSSLGSNTRPEIVYLWICVTATGFKEGVHCNENTETAVLALEQWLNVVDEAASLGATWVVLSTSDSLEKCPDVWKVCAWAQDTHHMMVGLHLKEQSLNRGDVDALKQLQLSKTRVLVRKEAFKDLQWVEQEGIVLWTANPQEEGVSPNCQGPTRMIFVNSQGILYTCGLVEGNEAYRMGHVFDTSLKHIVTSPDLPHHVHDDLHIVKPECDGCPSLIANFFDTNLG